MYWSCNICWLYVYIIFDITSTENIMYYVDKIRLIMMHITVLFSCIFANSYKIINQQNCCLFLLNNKCNFICTIDMVS